MIEQFSIERLSIVSELQDALDKCEDAYDCDQGRHILQQGQSWFDNDFKPKLRKLIKKMLKKDKPRKKKNKSIYFKWRSFRKDEATSFENALEILNRKFYKDEMYLYLEYHLGFMNWDVDESQSGTVDGSVVGFDGKQFEVLKTSGGEFFFDITTKLEEQAEESCASENGDE